MNMFAPEFSALMTILRSVGPVISTRLSCKSNSFGFRQEVRQRTRVDFLLALHAARQ
jgi:hypothetical protein